MASREQTLACSGAAGGRQPLAPGQTIQIITIPAPDRGDSEPGMWIVALGYETTDIIDAELDIFATVIWGSGRGQQRAEVDVPARGTQFTVSGAEGLEIRMTRTGGAGFATADTQVMANATVSISRSSAGIPAQRTLGPYALPWVAGSVRIPRFSREVSVVSLTPVTMAGCTLNYISENAAGAVFAAVPIPDPTAMPIPLGAEFFSLAAPADQQARGPIRVIWGLRL